GCLSGACLPTVIDAVSPAAKVAAGQNFACALLPDGTVTCWGFNNSFLQLGREDQANFMIPMTVNGITDAIAIVAGDYHACVLAGDGTVRCWGYNLLGQLGREPIGGSHASPAIVSGISGATALSAGSNNTCALLGDGTVRCWGDNAGGQLG